jgi:hypothetical protein
MQPELRTEIIRQEYWWCGVNHQFKHRTRETALDCIDTRARIAARTPKAVKSYRLPQSLRFEATEMFLQGATYKEIGARFDRSHQRTRQYVQKGLYKMFSFYWRQDKELGFSGYSLPDKLRRHHAKEALEALRTWWSWEQTWNGVPYSLHWDLLRLGVLYPAQMYGWSLRLVEKRLVEYAGSHWRSPLTIHKQVERLRQFLDERGVATT